MAIAFTATPSSPASKVSSVRLDFTGLDNSTPVYISIESAGIDTAKSPGFVGASDGTGLYAFSHIFPSAATYAIKLRKVSDNTQVSTGNLVVS